MLDANVILHLVNRAEGHERILERMKPVRKSSMVFSAITATELWQKVFNAKASKRANAETAALLNTFRILPFKGDAARHAGQLLIAAREKGKPIGWPDTMLAAHAIALGATVVTDNTKDFIRSGCQLANWRG